ncbi:hypothetical protein, partial [uncultured Roseivirga sp.]|uniref:hypothetical protein n=1 Tax=uncultured Roseivirga sp. TaxID=543088 RepID=UPI0030D7D774
IIIMSNVINDQYPLVILKNGQNGSGNARGSFPTPFVSSKAKFSATIHVAIPYDPPGPKGY